MGGAQSTPSGDRAAQIKEFPDQILNTIFRTAQLKDILSMSSPDKCSRYVFLTKNALDKLFYQINVEPKGGVPIYFAPVDELTLRGTDAETKQKLPARNMNCMRVAFFYIRLFQITGALALNMGDTSPIRGFSIQASSAAVTSGLGPARGPRMLSGGARGVAGEDDSIDAFRAFFPPSVYSPPQPLFTRVQIQGGDKYVYSIPNDIVNYQKGVEKENEYFYIESIEYDIDIVLPPTGIEIPIDYVYSYTHAKDGIIDVNKKYRSLDSGEDTPFRFVIRKTESGYEGFFLLDGNPIGQVYTGTPTEISPFVAKGRASRIESKINWNVPRMNRVRQLKRILNAIRQKHGEGNIPLLITAEDNNGPAPTPGPIITTGTGPIQQQQAAAQINRGTATRPAVTAAAPVSRPGAAPAAVASASASYIVPTAAPTFIAPATTPATPTLTAPQRIATTEFMALTDLVRRFLDDKSYPKAYAIGRAMILLNPTNPREQPPGAIGYSSDICRPKRAPSDFEDPRNPSMPYPQSQSTANIFFKSLSGLYYDKIDIAPDGRLSVEQTPPGRDALIKASYEMGLMFFIGGTQADQANFLYQPKVIKAPSICPQTTATSGGGVLRFNPDSKLSRQRAQLIGQLQKITQQLFKLQDSYNKAALIILKTLFMNSAKEFRIRPEVYKGGIPYVNKVAEKARALLLDYYRKSEAYYVMGIKVITEAQRQTPDLIQFAPV